MDGEEEEVDKKDKECQVTDWKEEDCSCQSGQPKKQSNRKFKNSRNQKRCMVKYPKLLLEKFDDCPATDCNDDEESTPKPVRNILNNSKYIHNMNILSTGRSKLSIR